MPDEKAEVPREFEFDVALSYASENGDYVRKVARALKKRAVTVFYDQDRKVDPWGEILHEFLTRVYVDRSRYVVVFLSTHYLKKEWPIHELRSAESRLLLEKSAYVLPVLLEDVEIPESLKARGYIDAQRKKMRPRKLAAEIEQKTEPGTPKARLRKRKMARLRRYIANGAAAVFVSGSVLWGIATHFHSHTLVERRGAVTPRFFQVHLSNSGLQASTMKESRLVFDETLPIETAALSAVKEDAAKDRVPPAGSLEIRLKPKDDEILPKCVEGRFPTFKELDLGRKVKVEVKVCESSGECKWISSEAFNANEISVFLDKAIPDDLPKRC